MTIRGHVKNGAVVLDEQVELPEGIEVTIRVVADVPLGEPRPSTAEALLSFTETWDGPPGELDRLIKMVQQEREADPRPSDDPRL